MTTDQLFDLVAPIAIMHFADLCYEKQAVVALQKLQAQERDPLVVATFGSKPGRNWLDYVDYPSPDNLPTIDDIYKQLFREIIEEEASDWTEFFDRWGAYAWRDANGTPVFSGDAGFCMPWYETAALLRERIADHIQEHGPTCEAA
jgi:hypothetical protein